MLMLLLPFGSQLPYFLTTNMIEKLKLQLMLDNMSRNFPCPECEYKATWKGNLQTHIKSIHKGITFPCSECDYKATDKSNLQRHIRTIHKGETFPCPECDFKAKFKTGLIYHINSVHKGETLQCPL